MTRARQCCAAWPTEGGGAASSPRQVAFEMRDADAGDHELPADHHGVPLAEPDDRRLAHRHDRASRPRLQPRQVAVGDRPWPGRGCLRQRIQLAGVAVEQEHIALDVVALAVVAADERPAARGRDLLLPVVAWAAELAARLAATQ